MRLILGDESNSLSINPLTTTDDYSRHQNSATLSVGAIRFEDRFCASRKGGMGSIALADCAWWLLQLAIEKAWLALDGPLFWFLVQTGVKKNGPFTL